MFALVHLKKIICSNGPRNSYQTRYFRITSVFEKESNANKDTTAKSSELLFNNESNNNQKAENISRAMTYYLKKLEERGNFFSKNVCLN